MTYSGNVKDAWHALDADGSGKVQWDPGIWEVVPKSYGWFARDLNGDLTDLT